MPVTNIGVVNYSSTSDDEVRRWAAAAQKQMHDDVAPAWGAKAGPGSRAEVLKLEAEAATGP